MEEQKYKFGVRYFSRTGHTKQIAEAMAKELGCEAVPTSERIRGYTDTLFLGGAIYAGKIILFGDAAIGDPCTKIRKLLSEKGFLAETETFTCKGSFKFIAKGHPNAEDLENARTFARKWMQDPE